MGKVTELKEKFWNSIKQHLDDDKFLRVLDKKTKADLQIESGLLCILCSDMLDELNEWWLDKGQCVTCKALDEVIARKEITMDKLLPCPFCGNEDLGVSRKCFGHGDYGEGIKCKNCSVEMTPYMGSAIKAWNTRTPRPLKEGFIKCPACHSFVREEAKTLIDLYRPRLTVEELADYLRKELHPNKHYWNATRIAQIIVNMQTERKKDEDNNTN